MLKKLVSLSVAVVSLFSVCTFSASAAGNYTDAVKTWTSAQTANGTPLTTGLRGKWDYTSSYVYNYNDSAGTLGAWVNREKTSTGTITVDRYYGGQFVYNGPPNKRSVPRGSYSYLLNYVREDGYGYAAVGVINSKVGYHKIAWSPDSI